MEASTAPGRMGASWISRAARTGLERHWTINGRFLAQPMTGVQRYARGIVAALDAELADGARAAPTVEILAPPGAADDLGLKAIAVRTVGRLHGHAWEQIELPRHARGGLLSLCNTGPLLHRRQIVCIHDVNTRLFPQSYSRAFRTTYRALMPALGRSAAGIATVSRYSAGELGRFGIATPDRIVLAPNGHEHALAWRPEPLFGALATPVARTVVLIGSPVPHKNAGLVLGLADRLARRGIGIAVVGLSDARVFKAAIPRIEADNVAWLGRVDDGQMAWLLQNCLCLAFPSFVEGFGLPPLEAMALGCPVVVSDRASLPEICGQAALYAPPDRPEEWLDRFSRLAGQPRLRAGLVEAGRARARAYRWRDSATTYLRTMAALDGVTAHGLVPA